MSFKIVTNGIIAFHYGLRKLDSSDEGIHMWVVKIFEDGEDQHVIAKHNGVKSLTTYQWICAGKLRYERLPRGGTRSKIWTFDQMFTWLREDSTVRFKLLRARVKAQFDKDVFRTTIGNCLNCLLIAPKMFHLIPFGRNNSDTNEILALCSRDIWNGLTGKLHLLDWWDKLQPVPHSVDELAY